jgi:ACR3 family arsenite efflux pump ArsB
MKPYLKFGLISGIVGIFITLLVYIMGLDKSPSGQYIGWINIPVTIILMVMCIKECRETLYNGFISFGQAFKNLFLMMLVSSVISGIFMFFYVSVINPSLIDYIKEQQILEMEKKGMEQAAIDQAMSFSEKFISPGMMTFWTMAGGLLLGSLIALIVSAIMKKNDPQSIA